MKKLILSICILLLLISCSEAKPVGRYDQLPSCMFSEDLASITDMEGRGWTVDGDPTLSDSVFGPAWTGDGGDFIHLNAIQADKIRFNSGTQDFSICFWVKTAKTDVQDFFDIRDNLSDGWVVEMQAVGNILFRLDTLNVTSSLTRKINDNKWHFVAVVVDRDDNMIPYVDTVAGNSQAVGGEVMETTITPMIGGRSYGAGNGVHGSMRNLMIFDRKLTTQEMSDIYHGTAFDYEKDLASHWPMSEVNPLDVGWKGNENNGTGTATAITGGQVGTALLYDGTDTKVSLATDSWQGAEARTLCMWVYPKSYGEGAGARIFSNNYSVCYYSAPYRFIYTESFAGNIISADNGILFNEWTFYCLSKAADCTGSAYVNGEPSTAADAGTGGAGTNALFIGNGVTSANTWDGYIDEVKIYDVELTQLQIEDIYVRER